MCELKNWRHFAAEQHMTSSFLNYGGRGFAHCLTPDSPQKISEYNTDTIPIMHRKRANKIYVRTYYIMNHTVLRFNQLDHIWQKASNNTPHKTVRHGRRQGGARGCTCTPPPGISKRWRHMLFARKMRQILARASGARTNFNFSINPRNLHKNFAFFFVWRTKYGQFVTVLARAQVKNNMSRWVGM